MKLLGYEIKRADGRITVRKANLQSVNSGSSWWNWWGGVRESYAGAWQQNVTVDAQPSLLAFSAVFACVTGIAGDIAKMRVKLSRDTEGIWKEVTDPHGNSSEIAHLKVLRKPNRYQTRIKFVEQWIVSKLLYGNAYILKERESRDGPVVALYVLDAQRVTVLVAEDGSVWYEVRQDHLSGVTQEVVTIPASEIIHDMMVSLWHPLIGVSPIYACGVSATMGNKIQANSTTFFTNLSRPSGMLSAPGEITADTAARLKAYWETNFGGLNVGRIAVAGDGLEYTPLSMPATDAQLIEQLKWTVEDVARAFHYPTWKLNGALPPYASGPEALTLMYYTDCLHVLIESLELCLEEGLGLTGGLHAEMDLEGLWRMDTGTLYKAIGEGIQGRWLSPNEGRFKANYAKVEGGDSPLAQHQDYSLAALAKRDAMDNPFAPQQAAPTQPAAVTEAPSEPAAKELEGLESIYYEAELRKELIPA